jgi:hypothetical protein
MTRPTLPSMRKHPLLTATAAAVLVGAVATAVFVTSDSQPPAPSAARAAERGYTDTVTVPQYDPMQARPATPRPDKLPPIVRASGECESALEAVRAFQDTNPSGLVLTVEQNNELAALMEKVGPGPSAVCDEQTAALFHAQELDPWMHWALPVEPDPAPELTEQQQEAIDQQERDAQAPPTSDTPVKDRSVKTKEHRDLREERADQDTSGDDQR